MNDVKSTASSLSRAHPLYRALLLSREARGRPVPPLLLHHRCEDRHSSAFGGLRRPNLIGLWPSSARDHGFGYSWPLLPLYLGCTWKRAAHGAHYPSPCVASIGKKIYVYTGLPTVQYLRFVIFYAVLRPKFGSIASFTRASESFLVRHLLGQKKCAHTKNKPFSISTEANT
jgi:hypothetical protein